MNASRTWMALSTSLSIHIGLVLVLGMGLMQPRRTVNRIEVNLEGAAVPGRPPGVPAPSPIAGPEMPRTASLPPATAVAPRLAVTAPAVVTPAPASFSDAGAPQLPVSGGGAAATGVSLPAVNGGDTDRAGSGSGPEAAGGGQGRREAGSTSSLTGYYDAIRARVDAAKRYPQMAQQRRQEGVVVVTFRLTSDGRLMDAPVVTRSSGSRQLDSAALMAVRRGAPYPAFPLSPKDMKALELPVKFFLR